MIGIDYRTRQRLDVHCGESYDFQLKPASMFGQLWWARKASDVRYRIPVNIALLSGSIGLILAFARN